MCESYYILYLIEFIVKTLFDFGSFIFICILCSISKKNPFETYYIGNTTDYFYSKINNIISINNQSEYNNVFLNRDNTEKYIFNETKNISSDENIQKIVFLRKLISKSFCSEIQDDFEKNRGTKLSNIFDLKYDKIHKLSIANLVVSCACFLFGILNVCLLIQIYSKKIEQGFFILYNSFLALLDVAKFILTIILVYFMEKSDIGKFDDFLDCKNVKSKIFKKISDINKLRICFYGFVILNMISQGIDKLEKSCSRQSFSTATI